MNKTKVLLASIEDHEARYEVSYHPHMSQNADASKCREWEYSKRLQIDMNAMMLKTSKSVCCCEEPAAHAARSATPRFIGMTPSRVKRAARCVVCTLSWIALRTLGHAWCRRLFSTTHAIDLRTSCRRGVAAIVFGLNARRPPSLVARGTRVGTRSARTRALLAGLKLHGRSLHLALSWAASVCHMRRARKRHMGCSWRLAHAELTKAGCSRLRRDVSLPIDHALLPASNNIDVDVLFQSSVRGRARIRLGMLEQRAHVSHHLAHL